MYAWASIIALGLTCILSLILEIYTISIHPKIRSAQMWFLTCVSTALWSGGVIFLYLLSPDNAFALFVTQILHVGSTLLIIFFFHFAISFLFRTPDYKSFLFLGYILAIVFLITIFIPGLFLGPAGPRGPLELWVVPGKIYWIYILYFGFYVFLSIKALLNGIKNNDGVRRKQIFYILLAGSVGFAGGMTNFLPQYFNIFPFGTFIVFLYPILITYGIFFPHVRIRFT